MSTEPEKKPLTLMVSSTVYGIEELLEKIYATLTAFGYDVWMSHKGTLPVSSTRTAFENCLHGVEQCDLFFGLITPQYGSGVPGKGELSITHEELLKAIELNKPRWIPVVCGPGAASAAMARPGNRRHADAVGARQRARGAGIAQRPSTGAAGSDEAG